MGPIIVGLFMPIMMMGPNVIGVGYPYMVVQPIQYTPAALPVQPRVPSFPDLDPRMPKPVPMGPRIIPNPLSC